MVFIRCCIDALSETLSMIVILILIHRLFQVIHCNSWTVENWNDRTSDVTKTSIRCANSNIRWRVKTHVAIDSYGTIRSSKQHISTLSITNWIGQIDDESSRIQKRDPTSCYIDVDLIFYTHLDEINVKGSYKWSSNEFHHKYFTLSEKQVSVVSLLKHMKKYTSRS
jgi:hypothetical protein